MKKNPKNTRTANPHEFEPIMELLEEENKSLKDELLKMNSELVNSKEKNKVLNKSLNEWKYNDKNYFNEDCSDVKKNMRMSLRTIHLDNKTPKNRTTMLSRSSVLSTDNNLYKHQQETKKTSSPDKAPVMFNELLNIKEVQILNLQEQINKKDSQIEDLKKQMKNKIYNLQEDLQRKIIEHNQLKAENQILFDMKNSFAEKLKDVLNKKEITKNQSKNYHKDVFKNFIKVLISLPSLFLHSFVLFVISCCCIIYTLISNLF